MKTLINLLAAVSLTVGVSSFVAGKTFIDYFQPTPIVRSLTTNTWGAPGILPRDPQNGLEDPSLKDLPQETDAEFVWIYHRESDGPFQLHPDEIETGGWFAPGTVSD